MTHIFDEAKLEQAIITLLCEHHSASGQQVYPHHISSDIPRLD